MFFEEGIAYAMAAPGGAEGGGNMIQSLMPIFIIIALFWFIILRPQQKKAKEQQALLSALKKGDQVVTSSGIYGRITGITDSILTLEIAPKVKIRINRSQIAGLGKPDSSSGSSDG